MADWYYQKPGFTSDRTIGPVGPETLLEKAKSGELKPEHAVMSPALTAGQWREMQTIRKLAEAYAKGEQLRREEKEQTKQQRRQAKEEARQARAEARQAKAEEKRTNKDGEGAEKIESDAITKLKKLADLMQSGAITPEEFESVKAKLLDEI